MTYHQLNELIQARIEKTRIQFRTSDMPYAEYLNRVAQLLESRSIYLESNREMVTRLPFNEMPLSRCVSKRPAIVG